MSLISDELLTNINEEKKEEGSRMANVVSSEDGKCLLQFYGEEEPSQLSYYVVNGITLSEGDTAVVMPVGNSFVVLGTVKKSESKSGVLTEIKTKTHNSSVSFNSGVYYRDVSLGESGYKIAGVTSMRVSQYNGETSTPATDVTILGYVSDDTKVRVFYNNTNSATKYYYLRLDVTLIK